MATISPKPERPTPDRAELLRILDLPTAEFRAAQAMMTDAERQEMGKVWLEEAAEAVRSSNEYVEKNGLPLAKYRSF